MKLLGVFALLAGCAGGDLPAPAGGVSVVLDVPDGAFAPMGYSSVELVLHAGDQDIVRSAELGAATTLDLDAITPPAGGVSIEATLRDEGGAAVGYGRTAMPVTLAANAEIAVPVLRPIAYIAGTVSRDADNDANTPELTWSEVPATYSDLSTGAALNGQAQVGTQVVLMVAAGPKLFMVNQPIDDASGTLTGTATIAPISTADHHQGSALSGPISTQGAGGSSAKVSGSVLDGAGTDDGKTLAIGTTSQLFAVDSATGVTRVLADGSFARVVIVTADNGETNAVAIRNRAVPDPAGTCDASAEIWWARLNGGDSVRAQLIATGGFSDVAAERGHAYYLDACKSEFGEVTAGGTRAIRSVAAAIAGQATALAVSNNQAFVGIESAPASTSLVIASLAADKLGDPPRTLWTEAAQQVMRATEIRGVQRQLDATSATFAHLEVGAGGEYVALTTASHFFGAHVTEANFPEMTIDTEEFRVFDASNGGIVQRYRSWCSGILSLPNPDTDIRRWTCASIAGQTSAGPFGHHINSMAFLFGKK